MSKKYKNVFVYLSHLLLTLVACTATDRQPQTPGTVDRLTVQAGPTTTRPCRQIVLQGNSANRYVYQFDSSQRLSQCTSFDQNNGSGMYGYRQQLNYTKGGLLKRVRDEEDSTRYRYRNGRLVAIDFFQEGQPVYRYLVATNEQGLIVGLRGVPLNDSGLPGYSTRYQLDAKGRYRQLDLADDRGRLYYRVIQRDFSSANGHLYGLIRGIPYDINRYPWLNWGEGFPISPYLAGRIETYRYAAPQTPTELIKRADISVTYQTDKQGYLTGQFSTDALTTIRDTVVIHYLNCR